MAVTHKMFGNFPHLVLEDGLEGSILDQTIKVMLLDSNHTFSQDDDYLDDVVANEASGSGYDAGGATLASKTCTYSTRVTTFDAANTSWASSTITASDAVIYYDDAGGDGDSLLISDIDFDGDQTTNNGTFELQWNGSGIFTITVAA